VKAVVSHLTGLWGRLWFLPLVPTAYAVVLFSIGDLRPEHIVFAALSAWFGFYGPRSKQFFVDVWPYIAVAFGYDLVRYARPLFVSPERVLGCNLREAELALFSVSKGVTLQDYFAVHHHPAFDLLFAVPYTIFLYVTFVYGVYLYFADRRRLRVYAFSFMIGNYLSFATWLLLPAAPPWYLRAHGCVIDTSVMPSPAALARVDELFGMTYFASFYSRASSVFGALPSMHCAYPMIGLLSAWHVARWRTRPIHVAYVILMACAAVYLDHHWVIDVIAGWITAYIAVFLSTKIVNRFYGEAPAQAMAPPQRVLANSSS
jgi:membrane-associated phospholipid phosphatase